MPIKKTILPLALDCALTSLLRDLVSLLSAATSLAILVASLRKLVELFLRMGNLGVALLELLSHLTDERFFKIGIFVGLDPR